ncbi:hypothetical protein [Glycomyces sp. NPDC048151]|uniref:hypothetical protein n=1 Tax=Glycomyces sp. NPDC048151 TaxID=3364002 RepID=UPI0037194028
MSVVFHALALADAANSLLDSASIAAGFVENPAPVDPTGGSEGGTVLLAMLKGGAVLAAAVGALISIYYLIFGRFADNPKALSNGKFGIPVALCCVVLTFTAIPMINALVDSLG